MNLNLKSDVYQALLEEAKATNNSVPGLIHKLLTDHINTPTIALTNEDLQNEQLSTKPTRSINRHL